MSNQKDLWDLYCAPSALDTPHGHNLGLHVSAIASHFDLGYPYFRCLQRPILEIINENYVDSLIIETYKFAKRLGSESRVVN